MLANVGFRLGVGPVMSESFSSQDAMPMAATAKTSPRRSERSNGAVDKVQDPPGRRKSKRAARRQKPIRTNEINELRARRGRLVYVARKRLRAT